MLSLSHSSFAQAEMLLRRIDTSGNLVELKPKASFTWQILSDRICLGMDFQDPALKNQPFVKVLSQRGLNVRTSKSQFNTCSFERKAEFTIGVGESDKRFSKLNYVFDLNYSEPKLYVSPSCEALGVKAEGQLTGNFLAAGITCIQPDARALRRTREIEFSIVTSEKAEDTIPVDLPKKMLLKRPLIISLKKNYGKITLTWSGIPETVAAVKPLPKIILSPSCVRLGVKGASLINGGSIENITVKCEDTFGPKLRKLEQVHYDVEFSPPQAAKIELPADTTTHVPKAGESLFKVIENDGFEAGSVKLSWPGVPETILTKFPAPVLTVSPECEKLGLKAKNDLDGEYFEMGVSCIPRFTAYAQMRTMVYLMRALPNERIQVEPDQKVFLSPKRPVTVQVKSDSKTRFGSVTLEWVPPVPPKKELEKRRLFVLGGLSSVSHKLAYPGTAAGAQSFSDLQIHGLLDFVAPNTFKKWELNASLDFDLISTLPTTGVLRVTGLHEFWRLDGWVFSGGAGLQAIKMLGEQPYGLNLSMGPALQLKVRTAGDTWAIDLSYSLLSKSSFSLSSSWIKAAVRYPVSWIGNDWFAEGQYNAAQVPDTVSGDTVNYNYQSLGLMLGFRFKE